MNIIEQVQEAKKASFKLASVSSEIKNKALQNIIIEIRENKDYILEENRKDILNAEKLNLGYSLKKRLLLDNKKLDDITGGITDLVKLEDPIGKVILKRELDNDLVLEKKVVPIGVIGVIFESRPDALVQISTLCIKSGNAAILKGGSEAVFTNKALSKIIIKALEQTDKVFNGAFCLAETREEINELLKLDEYIDLMVPRGSNKLVKYIQENTKIPVLGHSDGICHLYIDKDADVEQAVKLAIDSKCQYPAVCNAIETLIVHKDIAGEFLPLLKKRMGNVELKGDKKTLEIIDVKIADDSDWSTEYNDLVLSLKIVSSLDEAVQHINKFGSRHTDSIVTKAKIEADRFISLVDSGSVMWNCSTRFADGFRYGFGAEVGISTNKIHSRGPVGLEGLTIYKYIVKGHGNIVADYADGRKTFTHRDL